MQKETIQIIRGSLRKKILFQLINPCTPTILAKRLDTDRPSVSRSILFMEKIKVVNCINPSDDRGRLYEITALGRLILNDIKQIEGD